jgi:pimeloyl-ACP methyl ester carboxylesterase
MRPRRLQLRDGFEVEYVEQGDPSGVPTVLLHGYSDSWRSFEPLLPHLPPSIRAFAFSQRGHGDTDRPASGYQIDDFAADVAAFIDRLDLGRSVIVGHSMGATIAERVAARYPSRALGLVMMGAFAGYDESPGVTELAEAVSALTDPVDAAFVREFQESTVARPVPAALMDAMVHQSLKMPARVWRAVLRGLLDGEAGRDRSRLAVPTSIIWGDRDAFCSRREQEALLREVSGSTLIVHHGAGHALHWEDPAAVAGNLTAFGLRVGRVGGARSTQQRIGAVAVHSGS